MNKQQLEKYLSYMRQDHLPVYDSEGKIKHPRHRPKWQNLDGLHLDYSEIDGYQKRFNLITSPREPGKSTGVIRKAYKYNFMFDWTTLFLVRYGADVDEGYAYDIEETINTFSPCKVKITQKRQKSGAIDLYIAELGEDENGKEEEFTQRLFGRILPMNIPSSRFKRAKIPHLKFIVMDEFVCDMIKNEKYLSAECQRFNDIFTTYRRSQVKDGVGVVVYLLGNCYQTWSPYLDWAHFDSRKIRPGIVMKTENHLFKHAKIKPELKEKILRENPLYEFDEDYKDFGLEGEAVNDKNIALLPHQPTGARLEYVFKMEGKYFGYFKIPAYAVENSKLDFRYYCSKLKWNKEYKRVAFCFDFDNLENNSAILLSNQRKTLTYLARCIANGQVGFDRVESEYATEQIFPKII